MMRPDVTHSAPNSSMSRPSHITSRTSTVLDTSPTITSSSHPNFWTQPLKLPNSCYDPPLVILHPSTAEILHRVEAESIVDVETYVRAEGEKKYTAVKETRKEQLLHRAKREYGTEQLDDVTVRRQTNLASAKASRAKKNFILDELHSQLKRKSHDAQTLAVELRRVLALAEHLGTANKLAERQLQQQKALNSFLLKRTTQVQNSAVSEQEGFLSLEKLYAISSDEPLANDKISGMFDHTMLEVKEELFPPFSMAVYDGHIPFQTDLHANASCAEVHNRGATTAEINFERVERVDVSMGISDDVEAWKATDVDFGAQLLVVPDIADPEDLNMYNPSDQFTVAG